MESLADLRERRAFQCRLTPDRALRSVEEGDEFLRDRELLARTADCALPSLYAACHEDPYKIGSPGFGAWPATKWPWFGELAGRGHLVAAVHRGKNLLVTGEVARLLDPICRAEIERMRAADRGWCRLLDHLAAAGPSSIDDPHTELGLSRQEREGSPWSPGQPSGAPDEVRLGRAGRQPLLQPPAHVITGRVAPQRVDCVGLAGHLA